MYIRTYLYVLHALHGSRELITGTACASRVSRGKNKELNRIMFRMRSLMCGSFLGFAIRICSFLGRKGFILRISPRSSEHAFIVAEMSNDVLLLCTN